MRESYIRTEAMRTIETAFFDALEQWQSGQWPEKKAPFFVITGWPGIGKSMLLHHLKEACNEQENCQGYPIIDLDNRQRKNARYWQRIYPAPLRNIQNRSLCLFFDHVPPITDTALRGIDKQIIREHREQAFMVFALIDREQWGLTTPQIGRRVSLAPFTPAEIAALLSEDRSRLTEETFDELRKLGHPDLALNIARKGRKAGCESFLDHWLERVEEKALQGVLYSPGISRLAEEYAEVSETAIQEVWLNPSEIIGALRRAGWIGWSLDDKGGPDLWVPPVRYCLRVLGNR